MIAWLWARTVASSNPAARGAHVPLVSSFMLSTKAGKEAWVEPVLDPSARDGYRFEVRTGKISGEVLAQKKNGTKAGGAANFRCLLTDTIINRAHIVAEGKAGRMSARLMAIVAEGKRGRVYLPPKGEHAASAKPAWTPETDLPKKALGFRVQEYGMTKHRDLFTPRQLVALITFSDLVLEARTKALEDAKAASMDPDPTPLADGGTGAHGYADCLALLLAFALDKVANLGSTITSWMSDRGAFRETFARQAIPITWDFAEANIFSDSGGNFLTPLEKISMAIAAAPTGKFGKIEIKNAANGNLISKGRVLVTTDPPYYDNVPYADLSDFFYVWLRPTLRDVFSTELATMLVPQKDQELVAEPFRHGGLESAERFFLKGMSSVVHNMARVSADDLPVTFYYAFKQEEVESQGIASTGWATFLDAVTAAGFQIDGT